MSDRLPYQQEGEQHGQGVEGIPQEQEVEGVRQTQPQSREALKESREALKESLQQKCKQYNEQIDSAIQGLNDNIKQNQDSVKKAKTLKIVTSRLSNTPKTLQIATGFKKIGILNENFEHSDFLTNTLNVENIAEIKEVVNTYLDDDITKKRAAQTADKILMDGVSMFGTVSKEAAKSAMEQAEIAAQGAMSRGESLKKWFAKPLREKVKGIFGNNTDIDITGDNEVRISNVDNKVKQQLTVQQPPSNQPTTAALGGTIGCTRRRTPTQRRHPRKNPTRKTTPTRRRHPRKTARTRRR